MAYKRYQLPGPMPAQSYYVVDTAAESITGPADGDTKYAKDDDTFYTYDGSSWNAVGTAGGSDGSDHNILDHADANTTPAPNDGDVLTWVDGDSEWQAAAPSAPGGGGEIVWVFGSKVHPETGIGRRMYAPYDATILRAYAWCTDSAPTSTMTADILLEGTSIGGTKPTVTASNFLGAEVDDMSTTSVTQYDKVEIEVESTGGADGRIFVAVVVEKV